MRLPVAIFAVLACISPTCHSVGISCSEHCSFYGNNIISCDKASRIDIMECYNHHFDATTLDLGFTNLDYVTKDLFEGLGRIKRLYLDHTHPYTVDEDSFKDMATLHSVSLRGVGERVTQFAPALTSCSTMLSVKIGNNFGNCSCDWLSLASNLEQYSILVEDNDDTPQCTDADKESCEEEMSRRASAVIHHPYLAVKIGCALGGALVLIIIIIIITRCAAKKAKTKSEQTKDTEQERLYDGHNEKLMEQSAKKHGPLNFGGFMAKNKSDERLYGGRNEKLMEQSAKKYGPLNLGGFMSKNKSHKTEKKMKHTSDHIHADRENQEIRDEFLEKMAIRRSMQFGSDSDSDLSLKDVIIDGESKKRNDDATTSNIVNRVSNILGAIAEKRSQAEANAKKSKSSISSKSSAVSISSKLSSVKDSATLVASKLSTNRRSSTVPAETEVEVSEQHSVSPVSADIKSSGTSVSSKSGRKHSLHEFLTGAGSRKSSKAGLSTDVKPKTSDVSIEPPRSNTSSNNNTGTNVTPQDSATELAQPADADKTTPVLTFRSNPSIIRSVQHTANAESAVSVGAKSVESKASRRTVESEAELMNLLMECTNHRSSTVPAATEVEVSEQHSVSPVSADIKEMSSGTSVSSKSGRKNSLHEFLTGAGSRKSSKAGLSTDVEPKTSDVSVEPPWVHWLKGQGAYSHSAASVGRSNPSIIRSVQHTANAESTVSVGAKSVDSKASRRTVESDAELMNLLTEWYDD